MPLFYYAFTKFIITRPKNDDFCFAKSSWCVEYFNDSDITYVIVPGFIYTLQAGYLIDII